MVFKGPSVAKSFPRHESAPQIMKKKLFFNEKQGIKISY